MRPRSPVGVQEWVASLPIPSSQHFDFESIPSEQRTTTRTTKIKNNPSQDDNLLLLLLGAGRGPEGPPLGAPGAARAHKATQIETLIS